MSFISSVICRWHHYLWSRYRFSRALSWSWHTFWPGFSNIFLSPLDFFGPVLPVFPGTPAAPGIPFGHVPPLSPFSPFGRVRPVIPDFPDFPVVPWDLEDLSFPLVPSRHVVASHQWEQDIRGDLRDIPSHLTYSTWWYQFFNLCGDFFSHVMYSNGT